MLACHWLKRSEACSMLLKVGNHCSQHVCPYLLKTNIQPGASCNLFRGVVTILPIYQKYTHTKYANALAYM